MLLGRSSEGIVANSTAVAGLREIAFREIPRTRPSRLLWFVLGGTFATVACLLLYSIGLRVPPIGFGVVPAPGLSAIKVGMSYERVARTLGPEDGTLRAAELASAEKSLCSYCSRMEWQAFEEDGGRFLFWLSRSNGRMVFNVVAFDKNDNVYHYMAFDDTFFGMD
jgi:hypothetical protein